ncbi:MAG: NIL domain-containing protein [Syntrophales bacterium]|nr:NIL domain-containing protein [Syntrophales bacterium]
MEEKYSHKIVIRYTADIVDKPIVCRLAKEFDLDFNILHARILPKREGVLALDLSGTKDNFYKGIAFLKEAGLKVESLSKSVTRNEDRCVHCGACQAFCSTEALCMDPLSVKTIFDPDKCSGCSVCVKACPARAMEINLI